MTMLVTGGAGFIGANFVNKMVLEHQKSVVNVDKLTYAGHLANLERTSKNQNHHFIQGDIGDTKLVTEILTQHQPSSVINFAAESHVDRSISGPEDFIQTNIVGTFRLLECVKKYWGSMDGEKQKKFRFLHVSTDEVYGSLENDDPPFSEENNYRPNSPYSASKASSDHLVRAYHQTFGLPVLTTNCSNNYGPYQFPEKLIPLLICKTLKLEPIPIYGDGLQTRDWLYVEDHCDAILEVLQGGKIGDVYNIGGSNEKTNLEVVNTICEYLDKARPPSSPHVGSYKDLISFVPDRPGHDRRYAIDAKKISKQLGWVPRETFESGLKKTVDWYLCNQIWVDTVTACKTQ